MTDIPVTKSEATVRAIPYAAFGGTALAIWLAYFLWRPPLPILGLKHLEHWERDRQTVSLTFDDAPHPLTTPLLLASLKRTGVKGSFFCIGNGMRFYPELAERIAREGHRLANHSQYHINLTHVPPAEYAHEIQTCFGMINQIYATTGIKQQPTHLFRPPGGGLNRQVMQYLYENNMTLAWWSNNMGDWVRPPAWKIAAQVKATLRPGDIILLHDAGVGTPQALPNIIREVRSRGLRFEPMPEATK